MRERSEWVRVYSGAPRSTAKQHHGIALMRWLLSGKWVRQALMPKAHQGHPSLLARLAIVYLLNPAKRRKSLFDRQQYRRLEL